MENMQAEQFEIKCDNNMLVIYASDTLGFVYGLYLSLIHISMCIRDRYGTPEELVELGGFYADISHKQQLESELGS